MERRDRRNAKELIAILEEAGQEIPNELVTLAEKYEAFREREAEARKTFGRSFQGGGGSGCYNCGMDGHQSRDCPSGGRGGRGAGGGSCFNCGMTGHLSRNCSEPRRSR